MNRSTILLPACFSAFLALPANAAAAPCTPARAGTHVAAQPEAWRQAVEALVASSATPGQPWSCVGGEVDLEVGTSSAKLTVTDAQGHAISREVVSPDEVAPLGEALLAKPLPEPEPVAPPPTTAKPEAQPVLARDPRLLVAGTVGPRYAGPAHLMWGSFEVLATVPFRPWGAGVWLRYDGFSTPLDKPLPPLRDLCLGAAGYWSMSLGRVEFRPMLRPSLAVVTRRITINNDGPTMPDPQEEPERPLIRDDTAFDFRLGAEAQLVVGLTKRFRAVIGFDAEVSPERLISTLGGRRAGDHVAHFPSYTMGLGVGVEVAVP